jgi:hypothetical protein
MFLRNRFQADRNNEGKMIRIFRRNLPLAVALAAVFCLLLRHAFSHDRSFGLYRDNEDFLGPLLSAMSAALRHGVWPLRTDTFLGGLPFYDLPQLSAFYPFYFTWLPLFRTPFDTMYSMHWIVLIHILIAEINMCILLREVGLSRLSAVLGAALFAFSANSFIYAYWINIVAPYAWLPLYLTGLFGILSDKPERRYPLMAIGGMVMLVFASPAQPLIHAVFLTVVFSLIKVVSDKINGQKIGEIMPRAAGVVIVGILSLLIVSPVLMPVIFNLNDMIRWIGNFPAVIGNSPIPFKAFTEDQLTVTQLGGALFKMEGLKVGQQFIGLIPFSLAVIAVVWRPRSWFVQAMAFTAVYSILSAAGTNLGLGYVNYYLPILNKIREPSRFLFLFQFAIAALASVGLDELRSKVALCVEKSKLKTTAMPFVIPIGLAIAAAIVGRHEIIARVPPAVTILLLCALVSLTLLVRIFPTESRALFLACCWVVVALILQAMEVHWIPFSVPKESQYLITNASELDRALSRVAALDPSRNYRVVFGGKIDKQQASMLASYRGIRTLNAYVNPAPYRQFSEMYYQGPSADNYFFVLGAKFMICDICDTDAVRGYGHVEDIGRYAIYEAKAVSPRGYLKTSIDGYFKSIDQFKGETAGINPENGALFLRDGSTLALPQRDAAEQDCDQVEKERTVTYDRFETSCSSQSVLILNEFFDKSWSAYLDGERAEVFEVNGNQLGVALPGGAHFVEFEYMPDYFGKILFLMVI